MHRPAAGRTASASSSWAAARARGSSATWCRRRLALLPAGAARSGSSWRSNAGRRISSGCARPMRRWASQPSSPASSPTCPARMAAADLVITRSGASTVAELLALARPSLLVPYPSAADDHQTANAARLADGRCRRAAAAAGRSRPSAWRPSCEALMHAPERLAAMADQARALARPDAVERLLDAVLALAGETRPMTMMPRDVGPIHFVGIGGIGMSGIAEILHNLGYAVQGSDIGDSANVQRLRAPGHCRWRSAMPPRTWARRASSWSPRRSSPTIPSCWRHAPAACRSCGAPTCWPS